MSFDDVAIEWRIEDDQFVISFPHAGLGWSAVILGGRAAYIGADVIIVRSTRRGSEVLDAFVESGYSATVDEQLGGENQLRLIAVGQGRATVAKPLDGDEWDRDLAPGSRIRFAVAEGLLGVDTFPLLSLRETEVEL